jgi:phosphoesterase RecJ-like protein
MAARLTQALHALTHAVTGARTVLLVGPLDLDGDAVGAMLALRRAIRARWPAVEVTCAAGEHLPERYAFLPDAEVLVHADALPASAVFDLSIVLDGDVDRLGSATAAFRTARLRAQIDHHKSSDPEAVDVAFLDPSAASTTELVLQLCDHWGVRLDAGLASLIYAGLVFDTHVFRYRLTRPPTLRAAARLMETGIDHAVIVERVLLDQPLSKIRLRGRMLDRLRIALDGRLAWAVLNEAECADVETGGLVDDLVFIEGVEVGLLVIERARGQVKVSLRSRGGVDVARVAQVLSPRGGGHARAAGATVEGSALQVVERVEVEVRRVLATGRS